MLADSNGRPTKPIKVSPWDDPTPSVPPREAFVNRDPGRLPEGIDSHLDYLRRLAARGERDES
jgi:hypothetical protein